MTLSEHVPQNIKNAADAVAVTGTVATFLGYLPALAAGVTLIYTLVRLYETETVKKAIAWFMRIGKDGR